MSSVILPPTITVREGVTDKIIMQLLADDVAIDLTPMHHIEVEMRDMKRNVHRYSSLDASPKVGIENASEGKVFLEPPASLFKAILSPYLLYFLVFTDVGKWFGVPEAVEALIQVRRNW